MVIEKTCKKCGVTGDAADLKLFVKDSTQMGGKYKQTMNICRKCSNERDRAYRAALKAKDPDGQKAAAAARTKRHRETHPDYRRQEYEQRVEKYGLDGLAEKARNQPDARSPRARERKNARHWRLKLEVIAGYGGCCTCCGETHPKFLTVDHLENNGAQLRRDKKSRTGTVGYWDIISGGFPEDLTVRCWNCNSGRHINGGICPHEETRQELFNAYN